MWIRPCSTARSHSARRNEKELWQIFDQLTAQIEEGEDVIFDITNAFRSIPVIVFIAIAYLRSARNVQLKAITYGAFEAKEVDRTPVFDLSPFVNLLDWLNASDQFIRTGNATSLAGLLRQSKPKYDPQNKQVFQSGKPLGEAADALDDVSLALRLILPDRAMEASEKLQTKMGVAAVSIQKYAMPFTVLAEQVSATYTPLALPNPRSADNVIASLVRERNLIEWYLQRNQIVQAVSVAREWLVSWGMIQVGYRNLYDKSKRTKERLEGNVIVEG
ncbi:MAG: TIGR02221 family CRISPR-associated protein [Chloroflexi bacterium]|nr:TIGR02221 family CRISPR-associated protein [Chloroflexota bacterium]